MYIFELGNHEFQYHEPWRGFQAKHHTPICDPDPAAEEQVLKQFKDCFEGVGCFQGEYRITVDPAVPPVVHPPRRVPEALREPLKKELVSLVEQGILAKVTKPTDWVNSLVCVTKSTDALQLCLDP